MQQVTNDAPARDSALGLTGVDPDIYNSGPHISTELTELEVGNGLHSVQDTVFAYAPPEHYEVQSFDPEDAPLVWHPNSPPGHYRASANLEDSPMIWHTDSPPEHFNVPHAEHEDSPLNWEPNSPRDHYQGSGAPAPPDIPIMARDSHTLSEYPPPSPSVMSSPPAPWVSDSPPSHFAPPASSDDEPMVWETDSPRNHFVPYNQLTAPEELSIYLRRDDPLLQPNFASLLGRPSIDRRLGWTEPPPVLSNSRDAPLPTIERWAEEISPGWLIHDTPDQVPMREEDMLAFRAGTLQWFRHNVLYPRAWEGELTTIQQMLHSRVGGACTDTVEHAVLLDPGMEAELITWPMIAREWRRYQQRLEQWDVQVERYP